MARRQCAFATLNPFLTLAYLVLVIVFALVVRSPVAQAVGLVGALVSYLSVRGRGGWRLIAFALAVVIVTAFFNALFNPRGVTVLFTYLGGRTFTVEALALGLSTGVMFATALVWFACMSAIFTSDCFSYVLGRLMPSVTLVLSMSLRLVPLYGRKAHEMQEARRALGAGGGRQGTRSAHLREAGAVASALATWALESSIETADSMRSRGYGLARPTFYQRHPVQALDVFVAGTGLVLAACVAASLGAGALDITFLPSIEATSFTTLSLVGVLAYAVFSLIPVLVNLMEVLLWQRYLSRV